MDDRHWYEMVRPVLEGRKWVIALEVAAAATGFMSMFKDFDVPRPFVIAGNRGTGPVPSDEDAEIAILDTGGTTIMEVIRAFESAVTGMLPEAVQSRLDAWDPDGTAMVLTGFAHSDVTIGGRHIYGTRPRSWLELEDKTNIDRVWDEAGVQRASSEVVDATPEALTGAHRRLDAGMGTVWVADNTEGWHGGAEYLRWVDTPTDIEDAAAWMVDHAGTVRVMPFLDGIPCSIHGAVMPDHDIALRPCEMIVLRVRGERRLRYAGSGSMWDPPPEHRRSMRAAAHAVAKILRSEYSYRGWFTIDGVMTVKGFRPTELNARAGAAIGTLLGGMEPSPPIGTINRAVIAGETLDYRSKLLEERIVATADRVRKGGGHLLVHDTYEETEEIPIRFVGQDAVVSDNDSAQGSLMRGPAATGGMIRVSLMGEKLPVGGPAAPYVAAGFRLADDVWGSRIGPLDPAHDVSIG